jgi:hypothetical protein
METLSPILGVMKATEGCLVKGIVEGCNIAS